MAHLAEAKKDFIGYAREAFIGFNGYGSSSRLFFKSSKRFAYQFVGHLIAAEIGAGRKPEKEGEILDFFYTGI